MSFVTCAPAIGMTAVCRIAPPPKSARSVVPPPMSTRQTPRSFSSSMSTAWLEASCSRTMSSTSRPQRCTHLTMFWAALAAPVTMCTWDSSRTPRHPDRFPDPVLVVDDELLGEDVQDLLVGRNRNRARGVDDAVDVAVADLAVANRHDPLRVEAADVTPGHPDVDRPDGLPGHDLGLLHRVPDGFHGVLDVDHHAPLEAAREIGADPEELNLARIRGLPDQRHHLRGADVEPRDEALPGSRSHPCTLECTSPPSRQRTAKPFG